MTYNFRFLLRKITPIYPYLGTSLFREMIPYKKVRRPTMEGAIRRLV
jgi:hypothetical protein